MTTDIFISYSRKDIAFARLLVDALKGQSLTTWIDWEDIPPSADWMAEIHAAIERADAFVFILSPASAQSEVCGKEIEHAIKNKKRVIPIALAGVRPEEMPEALAALNWIFFPGEIGEDFQKAFDKLVQAAQTDLEWVRAHTRLQVRALEWIGHDRNRSYLLRGADLAAAERWLGQAGGKSQANTAEQAQYIIASHQHAVRQQRLITMLSGLAVLVMAVLTVWGLNRANEAETQRKAAEEQAKMSLARLTSMQAIELYRIDGKHNIQSVLLAIESINRYPESRSLDLLQEYLKKSPSYIAQYSFPKVLDVVFGVNGKSAVIQGEQEDGLWLIDLETGYQYCSIIREGIKVTSVAISPDGKQMVSGWEDGGVWVSEGGESGFLSYSWYSHQSSVDMIEFSADGNRIISSDYYSIRVWDLPNKRELSGRESKYPKLSIGFSPDGRWAISSHEIEGTYIWDVITGKEVFFDPHPIVIIHPDGKQVGIYTNNELYFKDILDSQDIQFKGLWPGELEGILGISFSPDGEWLVGSNQDGFISVWEIDGNAEIYRIAGEGWLKKAVISRDGQTLMAIVDNEVVLWELSSFQEMEQTYTGGFEQTEQYDSWFSFKDGDSVSYRNFATDQEIQGIPVSEASRNFAISPEGSWLAFVGGFSTTSLPTFSRLEYFEELRLYNVASGKETPLEQVICDPSLLEFSSDGKLLIETCVDGTIQFFDTLSGRKMYPDLNVDFSTCLSISPDGKRIAIGSYLNSEYMVRVWNISTGEEISRLSHDDHVRSVEFSPDGKLVVSSSGGAVHVWNWATGVELSRLVVDNWSDNSRFSVDGQMVLTQALGDIYIWEAATGHVMFKYSFEMTGFDAFFNQDGTKIILVDDFYYPFDFYTLNWQPKNWVDAACARLTRNLTQEEWVQYFPQGVPYHQTCPNLPVGE